MDPVITVNLQKINKHLFFHDRDRAAHRENCFRTLRVVTKQTGRLRKLETETSQGFDSNAQKPGITSLLASTNVTPNIPTDRNSKAFEVRSAWFCRAHSFITELEMLPKQTLTGGAFHKDIW